MNTAGHAVTVTLAGRPEQAVFYAPLSVFWLLDATAPEPTVQDTVHLTRSENRIFATRNGVTLLVGPEMLTQDSPGSDAVQHPLARFHDRLLSVPLARPLAGLPAGSRFDPGGTLRQPGATRAGLWESHGDHIVITRSDGRSETFHWSTLDAALKGNAG